MPTAGNSYCANGGALVWPEAGEGHLEDTFVGSLSEHTRGSCNEYQQCVQYQKGLSFLFLRSLPIFQPPGVKFSAQLLFIDL